MIDRTDRRVLPHEGGRLVVVARRLPGLAFDSNLTGDRVIMRGWSGSELVDISKTKSRWQVAWSPDGRSILFASHHNQSGTRMFT